MKLGGPLRIIPRVGGFGRRSMNIVGSASSTVYVVVVGQLGTDNDSFSS